MRRLTALTVSAAALALAGAAAAHPKLLAASPAANATVAAPGHVELHFSEKLVPAFSTADVTMAAMPGMAAMKMVGAAAIAPDGHTLVITPKSALPAGHYIVAWHVVSTDTHKVTGSYTFAVK